MSQEKKVFALGMLGPGKNQVQRSNSSGQLQV